MPILKWFPPQGAPRTFVLYKPVTTIGRALGNDVAIPASGVSATHVQILFDGRDFNLEESDQQGEIAVNGKKKRRARLVHGDRITLGDVELSFGMFDEPDRIALAAESSGRGPHSSGDAITQTDLHVAGQQLAGLAKLYEFSEKLMTIQEINALIEAMLDAVIEVTGAEKGLILLHDDAYASEAPTSDGKAPPGLHRGGPVIRPARDAGRSEGGHQRQYRPQGAGDWTADYRERRTDRHRVQLERERLGAPLVERHVCAARFAGAGPGRALSRK
jgi:predicted component of type VI protein secretion system